MRPFALVPCHWLASIFLGLSAIPLSTAPGQDDSAAKAQAKPPAVLLQDFRPNSMLRVPVTRLTSCKFPSIDIHTHFGARLGGSREQLDDYVRVMDENRIAMSVSLDATLGKTLDEHQRFLCE